MNAIERMLVGITLGGLAILVGMSVAFYFILMAIQTGVIK